MTDGVARELEQAEARLAERRDDVHGLLLHVQVSDSEADLVFAAIDAAIEVGRLRALPAAWVGEQQAYDAAWSEHREAGYPVDRETHRAFGAGWLAASRHYYAALAAREEA